MPLYMLQAAYAPDDPRTLAGSRENREEMVATQLEKLGGRLLGFYRGDGRNGAVAVYELPDDVSAGSFALSVGRPGHLKDVKTTKLRGAHMNRFRQLQVSGRQDDRL